MNETVHTLLIESVPEVEQRRKPINSPSDSDTVLRNRLTGRPRGDVGKHGHKRDSNNLSEQTKIGEIYNRKNN